MLINYKNFPLEKKYSLAIQYFCVALPVEVTLCL